MVVVHRELVFDKYDHYGDWCSCCVCVLHVLLSLIFAFLLSILTHNFWLTHNFYVEHPQVTCTQDMVVSYEALAEGSSTPTTFLWTSNEHVNSLIPDSNFFFPTHFLTTYEGIGWRKNFQHEHNLIAPKANELADRFEFEFQIPLEGNVHVQKVSALLFFKLELSGYQDVVLDSVINVQSASPVKSSAYTILGNMQLSQRKPLFHYLDKGDFAGPIFKLSSVQSLEELNFGSVLFSYKERELSSIYEKKYDDWVSGSTENFKLKIYVDIPEQSVWYTPWIWEVLKVAYVQYFVLFITVYFILWRIKGWFVRHDYLSTRRLRLLDLKANKIKYL